MKRFLAEPLVQFIFLGLLLFLILESLAPAQLSVDRPFEIEVSDTALKEYLQFQRKSFDANAAANLLKAMSADEKRQLETSFVRDEVLFREAMGLGLDNNDEIIRRRLIQKMEYIAQGFYDDIPPITEAQLTQYFADNRDVYTIDSSVTFTHVFIKAESKTPAIIDSAKESAERLRDSLNNQKVAFEDSGQYGDRFLYNRNYIERTPEYIASHFGERFQKALFELQTNKSWQGPIQSQYGFHLVFIKDQTGSRSPELSEVAKIVLADAQREQRDKLKAQAIDELIAKYTVVTSESAQ